ncbi:serine/threonine-protein kinase, partial [Pseudonocardia nigra]|uniref:serine/threonine-protein kinase n=1 Tax=Pseudonocardia nigra TaxID=1921578 RepID=UPI001C5F9685
MTPDHPALGVPGLAHPEVIGQGGYGTVYAVDEPEFGRKVAVKVLHDRLDGDNVRRAFVRECQAMGALSVHPHIVTVHRGGTTGRGEPYIVMDLMSGGSLADRMRREGPLPWAEVLEVAVTVAGALETAHRAGILHLDLKPANVLVSRYGEPKLGDFGISRLPGVTETTGSGKIRASVAYAAPERLLEGTATPAADLYGLGATMFALLTGRPAFVTDTAEEPLATVARIVREPVPDLRPRGVPDPVCRVVEQLLAKSPAERPASAAEAIVALQTAQRATGRAVTRAVVDGALPGHGDTLTWDAPPSGARPLVGEAAALELTRRLAPGRGAPERTHVGPVAGFAPPTLVGAPLAPPPSPPAAPARSRRPAVLAAVAAVLVAGLGAGGVALYLAQDDARPTGTPTFAAGH